MAGCVDKWVGQWVDMCPLCPCVHLEARLRFEMRIKQACNAEEGNVLFKFYMAVPVRLLLVQDSNNTREWNETEKTHGCG